MFCKRALWVFHTTTERTGNMHLTDIHCHLLPGVDDGPDTIKGAGRLLDLMKEEGVERIIVTPHFHPEIFGTSMERIQRFHGGLREMARRRRIRLYLGCEFYRCPEMIHLLAEGGRPSMAESSYVLVEFAPDDVYQTVRNYIYELRSQGWKPIIAHVERYECCYRDSRRVRELAELGASIQVNASAVLGKRGVRTKSFCKNLIEADLVSFIASDAHDERGRRPNLGKCARYVAKKYGQDYARKIFEENPEKILRDRRRK